jgi:hypothetical protein
LGGLRDSVGEKDSLIDFVSSVSGDSYLKVEENLGDGFVRLRISEAERRQAKHDIRSFEDVVVELLRNARDAHAQRIFVASSREGEIRTLTMIDDGVGIPESLQHSVFEPRVTSKLETMVMDRWGVHGRGMALYSVRENVTSASVACSQPHKGTAISITSDAEVLTERADQSSWPTVERNEAGVLHVARGPHNIIRRIIEFACEHPEVDVYYGSPVEIAATAHGLARDDVDSADLLFCDEPGRLLVWQRVAGVSDAAELVEVADGVGLSLSERTAHRILAGEIPPAEPVMRQIETDDEEPKPDPGPDIYRDRRGLKIDHADLTAFKREVTDAFDALAEKYYLHLRGEPKVHVGREEIRIKFEVDKED